MKFKSLIIISSLLIILAALLNTKAVALTEGGGGGSFGGGGGGAGGLSPGTVGAAIGIAKAVAGAIKANCGMGGGPSNFGGRIKKMCKCKDRGVIIKIGGPRGGNFYFGKGSILYLFGSLKKGSWTLGLAGGTKTCFDVLEHPRPMSGKVIRPIGTSMF